MSIDIRLLIGPTASGKSSAGYLAAQKLGAEIVSLDSMQVYKGMNIGTATPSEKEQATLPHHCINKLEPSQRCDISYFLKNTDAASADISSRGKKVIALGGSAMYVKCFTDGLFDAPPSDASLREKLETEYDKLGANVLHSRLSAVDSTAASKFHQNDKRRVVRALEVYELTGKPLSSFQTQFGGTREGFRFFRVGIMRPREELYERIDARVDAMIEEGLLKEVELIAERRETLSREALQCLGYKEFFPYIDGDCTLDEAIATLKLNTRHFARKQLTWYRKFTTTTWLDVQKNDTAEEISELAIAEWKRQEKL